MNTHDSPVLYEFLDTILHPEPIRTAETLEDRIQKCKFQKHVLLCLFCIEGWSSEDDLTLIYLFEDQDHDQVYSYAYKTDGTAPSTASLFPIASLYEREIQDGYGIRFLGALDTRRLFLHEPYPELFHPLRKKEQVQSGTDELMQPSKTWYEFKKINGKGVYELAVGPVHAGIIEPGHFRFSVLGETICNLETRMGYLHRGLEKTAEGMIPEDACRFAESVSGDESAANTACFCMALEKLLCLRPSCRSQALTGIALEMERISCLLADCAGMLVDVAYPAGASPFLIAKEDCMRMNKKLFGHRFIREYIRIGGVKHDCSDLLLADLSSFLTRLQKVIQQSYEAAIASPIVLDRFSTTGIIKQGLIPSLNLTGPVARASGSSRDTRVQYPYGIYRSIPYHAPVESGGDVLSRFTLKYQEILASSAYIRKICGTIPDDGIIPIQYKTPLGDGLVFAMVEGPRGQNLHIIHLRDGRIWRYKVKTASFCNWKAIEHAVMDNIVPDFPLINKSLNLSYAGNDL